MTLRPRVHPVLDLPCKLLFFVAATWIGPSAVQAQVVAITGGTVITVSGPQIDNGTVILRDGRIAAVGRNVSVPSDATVVDARGKFVMPGLIDAMTYYGIDGADLNETTSPLTPELRVIEAYYPFGTFGSGEVGELRARDLLMGGITTQYIAPADQTIIGGQGAVVKTAGPTFESLIVREPAAIDITLGQPPANTFGDKSQRPSNRMGVVTQLRELLVKAQEYRARVEAYEARPEAERGDAPPPARNLGMEALGRLLDREVPARIQANRATEIRVAMKLAEEFDFDLVIDGGASAHRMKDELAAAGVPVVLGPVSHPFVSGAEIPDPDQYPAPDERNAGWLTENGIKVAFGSFSRVFGSLARGIGGQWLLLDAAIAAGHGLGEDDVYRAVTLSGAEILGVSDRVGSIEVGKDADVIVLDGNPLSITTWVELVYVNGQLVYEREQ